MLLEHPRNPIQFGKWHIRHFGDIEQRVVAVAHVEHPQHRELPIGRVTIPADRLVQATPAQLGFALRIEIDVDAIAFEYADHIDEAGERLSEMLRAHEAQIVGRRMVFGKTAVGRSHKTPDSQIEPGRAELALVVTVRKKRLYAERPLAVLQYVLHHSVNFGVSSTALLVCEWRTIPDAGHNEAMTNPVHMVAIQARAT